MSTGMEWNVHQEIHDIISRRLLFVIRVEYRTLECAMQRTGQPETR